MTPVSKPPTDNEVRAAQDRLHGAQQKYNRLRQSNSVDNYDVRVAWVDYVRAQMEIDDLRVQQLRSVWRDTPRKT